MGQSNMDMGVPNQQGAGANPQGNQQPIGLSQFERDMNLALQMSLEEAKKNENKGSTATPSNINAAAEKNKTLEEIEEVVEAEEDLEELEAATEDSEEE